MARLQQKEREAVKRTLIIAALALVFSVPAHADAQKQITCTGILVDVWQNRRRRGRSP